jgi:hypothetical protein
MCEDKFMSFKYVFNCIREKINAAGAKGITYHELRQLVRHDTKAQFDRQISYNDRFYFDGRYYPVAVAEAKRDARAQRDATVREWTLEAINSIGGEVSESDISDALDAKYPTAKVVDSEIHSAVRNLHSEDSVTRSGNWKDGYTWSVVSEESLFYKYA